MHKNNNNHRIYHIKISSPNMDNTQEKLTKNGKEAKKVGYILLSLKNYHILLIIITLVKRS